MKRILVLDMMFSAGHKKFNEYYLNLLREENELVVINNGDYYGYLSLEGVTLENVYSLQEDLGSFKNRKLMIEGFKEMIKMKYLCVKEDQEEP